MSLASVTAIQEITLLLIFGVIALQGTVMVDLRRKLSLLRRQVLADRPPLDAGVEIYGKGLPELDGVGAMDLRPAIWANYLPNVTGLVIVLDPIEESCWFIAERLAGAKSGFVRSPYVVLLAASALDAERFLLKTALSQCHGIGIVLVGPRSTTLRELGVRWRPAVIAVRKGVVVAAAQFHDAKHLDAWARATLDAGGNKFVASV